MQPFTIEPVAPHERIQTIDIIRAFALFGVVVANFTTDNVGVMPAEGRTGFLDQIVYWPIRFFIDDKAMAMYCFLFGLGFSIILLRAESRKGSFFFITPAPNDRTLSDWSYCCHSYERNYNSSICNCTLVRIS